MDPKHPIVTLHARSAASEAAFALHHDRNQKKKPGPRRNPSRKGRAKTGSTPNVKQTKQPSPEEIRKLVLSFDHPPKGNDGFLFGTDSSACDVVLENTAGIHGQHFCISFDDENRVVLKNLTDMDMSVSYDDYCKHEHRKQFTWILFSDRAIVVSIPKADFSFDVKLADLGTDKLALRGRVCTLLRAEIGTAKNDFVVPPKPSHARNKTQVNGLGGGDTGHQRPIYLPQKREQLGAGAFGVVRAVQNVSSGQEYAAKTFKYAGVDVHYEINLMKRISHAHIVRFVDAPQTPQVQLIMELATFGNLRNFSKTSRTHVDPLIVLRQSLEALVYLHSMDLAHRDITPQNILVTSKHPLCIKLADFGAAKQDMIADSGLHNGVGTFTYLAPEVTRSRRYSVTVDIWSLGVVILELSYGLPSRESLVNWVLFEKSDWHREIADAVAGRTEDRLAQLLSSSMLRIHPDKRRSSAECLSSVKEIEATATASDTESESVSSSMLSTPSFVPSTYSSSSTCEYDESTITSLGDSLSEISIDPSRNTKKREAEKRASGEYNVRKRQKNGLPP